MKRIHLYLILALILTSQGILLAQSTLSYGMNPYYGAVFRYKSDMPVLDFTHLHGFELYIKKQTDGSKYWESKYNYPQIGFAAEHYNYGDPKELGKVYSATTFLDFGYYNNRKSQFRMNLGTGIVFSDVIYDPENNPANKAIGASLSFVLRGTIYYHYQFHERWALNLNASFRHFSNGRTQMPNNGMNFPMIGVGVEYKPVDVTFKEPEVVESYNDDIKFNLYAATARREVHYVDHKHKAYTISAYLSKRVSWYNSLSVGMDGFYYSTESLMKHLSSSVHPIEKDDIDEYLVAVTIGNEFHIGRVALLIQGGYYIHDKHKLWATWYQRYALKISVNEHFFIQPSLKAHSRTANMIEWGMGVTL